jgi:hypothetical protein
MVCSVLIQVIWNLIGFVHPKNDSLCEIPSTAAPRNMLLLSSREKNRVLLIFSRLCIPPLFIMQAEYSMIALQLKM